MAADSKFHQKPFTMIGSIVFFLVGVLHAARVVLGTPVMIGDFTIPLWISYPGAGIAILLALMLWRENIK